MGLDISDDKDGNVQIYMKRNRGAFKCFIRKSCEERSLYQSQTYNLGRTVQN